jgi:phospholipase C
MRLMVRILLLVSVATTFVHAQNTNANTKFQHVIVVVQENRTPDNLFGSDAFASPHQLPGADLVQAGKCYKAATLIPLRPLNLGNSCDPNHGHNGGWIGTYHNGGMDGACTITATGCGNLTDPEYTYVKGPSVVPYFQIAEQYGYGNYFFQTNQGPSFPAHQFLISGTSAPIFYNDPGDTNKYWQWFAAENSSNGKQYGCTANEALIPEVDPGGKESKGYNNGYPCYNHNTLANLLDPNGITWKYYARGYTSLWTGPNAMTGICVPSPTTNPGDVCTGSDWLNDVQDVLPNALGYPNSFSPVLTDLGADTNQPQCTLPAVSWVIPDGNWSDHGGSDPDGAGPSWVAALVNAVGGYDNNGNKLATNCQYWTNTAVLITWDDWGGFYDHVLPWNCTAGPNGKCSGYPNTTGQQYVYGFRVPLLVVSAYTAKGYISGALPPYGQGEVQPYIHDFGSILNFIEYALGQNGNSLGTIGDPLYPYADFFAPDAPNAPGCSPVLCPYSLSDFFNFQNQRTFTPFTQGIKYATDCFLTPKIQGCFGSSFAPADPDADAVDPQD